MKLNIYRITIAVVIAVCFCSLTLHAKRPKWLKGDSKEHPKEVYLTGIGTGSTLDAAQSAARAEILKVFDVKVADVSAQGIIEEIATADTWFNKKEKTHYVLAVLDKNKTKINLAQKISDDDEKIQAQLKTADSDISPVKQVRALAAAIKTLDKKNILISKKRIIDTVEVPELAAGLSKAEMQRKKDEALSRMLFAVMDESSENYNLEQVITARVIKMGFVCDISVLEKAKLGSFISLIKCSLKVSPSGRKSGKLKSYSWKGSIQIVESGVQGKLCASKVVSGEESHLNSETAKEKTIAEATLEMGAAVEKLVNWYIFGD